MRAWYVTARWVLHDGKFNLQIPLPTDTVVNLSKTRLSVWNNVDLNLQGPIVKEKPSQGPPPPPQAILSDFL